jgi:hypothetical protein
METQESQDGSFIYKEEDREKGGVIDDLIMVLNASDSALSLEELRKKIDRKPLSRYAIESILTQSREIKQKKIRQVMKEFSLKKYSFNANPQMRIFYINEEQVKNFAKKSPYFTS